MKEANIAPLFACLYPGLCDIARANGYALAIHGSVVTDLDLIAVPWTEAAIPAEELKDKLMSHLGACGYRDLLRQTCEWATPEQIEQMFLNSAEAKAAHPKPHGRIAWNLYLRNGVKIDLSVMPRSNYLSPPASSVVAEAESACPHNRPG